MLKIYHNNRCGKSRGGLKILENSGKKFEIINYLKTPPNFEELQNIINYLGITPIELVRKNEQIWKENYKGKNQTDKELIEIMVKNPQLIERPIVINGTKGVIGRPPEKINEIL